MPDFCCAPGCHNSRGKDEAKEFYRIPKDPERRSKWITALKRGQSKNKKNKRWEPTSTVFRVCSDHFISGKKSENPLSPDYNPSIFHHVPSPEKRRLKMRLEMFKRRQKSRLQRLEQAGQSSSSSAAPFLGLQPTSQDHSYAKDSSKELTSATSTAPQPTADLVNECNDELEHVQPEPTLVEEHAESEPVTPTCESVNCKKHIQSLELECQALRTENMLLKDKLNKNALDEISLQNNDKKVNMLTGLQTYTLLMTVFHIVAPYLKPKSCLTLFQQCMLTLIKLRMNLSLDFLGFYFGVDPSTISKLFKCCINVMYIRLVPNLVIWPDRESVRLSLPYEFRNKTFDKTVCILDCFEIYLERPSNLLASAQCYSSYKSHHTMKYLIGIAPQGTISFISNGWGGRTSDKFITENSAFLAHLLPGDLVLADRGFNVSDSIHNVQAELKIPAFTRGKKQLDPVDLETTRCLASHRIHIERCIGVLRQKYTVLQSIIPISFTDIDRENDVTYLDKMVKVCCALTNVCESVVPFQ